MGSSEKKVNRGVILIFLSTLMFGSYGVWSRLIGSSLGALFQGWTRGLVISLILIPILISKKQIIRIEKKDWKWLVIFLIFTSATQAPIFYAFNHMDIGSASLLFFVSVLLTMYLVGFLFFKEKVTNLKLISFVLALVGLYTIFSFSVQKFSLVAALMAILNGIASGGEVSFSKKLSGSYSPLYVNLMSWLIIIPTNGLLSVVIGEKQLLPAFNLVWFWQFCYIFVSFFAFWFVISGLKYVEASIGELIGLLEAVFSILFGIFIFGENLTIKIVIGSLFILCAASLPNISGLMKKQSYVKM
jgi:drug/metabolite transporter (DMT)-like permease